MAEENPQVKNLRKRGVSLPKNENRKVAAAHELHNLATNRGDLRATVAGVVRESDSEVNRIKQESQAIAQAMGSKRNLSRRYASQGSSSVGGDVYAAIPRFYDPLEYWDISGLPWNMADEGHRKKLHKWLRLYYATHYLIPILVDIFTRFPLVGMELDCKDSSLADFYDDLFLNQLDYQEFLVSLGREFWCVGEAFPMGSFDEDLGIWEYEELLNPEDIIIKDFPFLQTKQFKVVPPEYLKKLAQQKTPPKEYAMLKLQFPELIPYLLKGEHIPVSNVLLKQVGNKLNDWDEHGTPILLRGLRTLLHEEKLLASQDAIAERLYSPMILAKLGIQDLGDGQGPWIPGPEDIESVRDDFDLALSSDFRLMVHHFGIDVTNVFGREQMPRLGDDFDRVERRLMQVFGINPSLLSAGSNSQPYASSALQAEFLNQILRTYQNMLKKHFKERASVVAEAQGHYDYELRGKTRVPLYEEVIEYDDDGNKVKVEKHKLLIPDLKFQTLDLRDEATERQFFMNLRQMGVPIPNQDLLVGLPDWNMRDKISQYNTELEEQTISQQQAKMDTYTALVNKNLPVPADLAAEVQSVLGMGPGPSGAQGGGVMGPPGGGEGGPPGGGGPNDLGGSIQMPDPPTSGPAGPGGSVPGGGPPPASGQEAGPAGTVPQVSNERRPGLTYNTNVNPEFWPIDAKIRDVVARANHQRLGGTNKTAVWILDNLQSQGLTFAQSLAIRDSWHRVVTGKDNISFVENLESATIEDNDTEERPLLFNEELKGEGKNQRIVTKLTKKQQAQRSGYTANDLSIIDPRFANEQEEISE